VDVPSVSAGFTMMFLNRIKSFKNEINDASFWQSISNLSRSLQLPNQRSNNFWADPPTMLRSASEVVTSFESHEVRTFFGSQRCFFLLWMDEGFCVVTVAASFVYEVATKRIQ